MPPANFDTNPKILRQLEAFILELGRGFAFVERQKRMVIDGEDFYLDLLFYHLKLRCFVVIDLKRGGFKPEFAGKINFYCNVVDDQLRHESDKPTIGLILCQQPNQVLAEYALRGMDKPIGIAGFELTRQLPTELQSSLPSIESIEQALAGALDIGVIDEAFDDHRHRDGEQRRPRRPRSACGYQHGAGHQRGGDAGGGRARRPDDPAGRPRRSRIDAGGGRRARGREGVATHELRAELDEQRGRRHPLHLHAGVDGLGLLRRRLLEPPHPSHEGVRHQAGLP